MKNLILVNGTMGVGKTATCRALMKRLPRCAFLDGDWCWDMSPFVVTDETKAMVTDNICHVLNNFLRCTAYDNILFCWVMHEQSIIRDITDRLRTDGCRVHLFSLVCSEEALVSRLSGDVESGLRESEIIARSVARRGKYRDMDTVKIDTSGITAGEAAERILARIGGRDGIEP